MPIIEFAWKSGDLQIIEEVDGPATMNPREFIIRLLKNYNRVAMLRYGKNADLRSLVAGSIKIISKYNAKHSWEKQNACTLKNHLGLYDALKCEVCHITAKRYDLVRITIDAKYKARCYQKCNTALLHLAKKTSPC